MKLYMCFFCTVISEKLFASSCRLKDGGRRDVTGQNWLVQAHVSTPHAEFYRKTS